ncbi:hypothetical protein ASF25_07850 [Methylobacterium sp. Leaf100]|nr:hypothetical protein ASF25_07850 [Methylobacterium sp. Leaf100]
MTGDFPFMALGLSDLPAVSVTKLGRPLSHALSIGTGCLSYGALSLTGTCLFLLDGLAPHTGSERKPLAECLSLIAHPALKGPGFFFLGLSRGAGLE